MREGEALVDGADVRHSVADLHRYAGEEALRVEDEERLKKSDSMTVLRSQMTGGLRINASELSTWAMLTSNSRLSSKRGQTSGTQRTCEAT